MPQARSSLCALDGAAIEFGDLADRVTRTLSCRPAGPFESVCPTLVINEAKMSSQGEPSSLGLCVMVVNRLHCAKQTGSIAVLAFEPYRYNAQRATFLVLSALASSMPSRAGATKLSEVANHQCYGFSSVSVSQM